MFDLLHNTTFYLSLLSLVTSLITLFSIGHVTSLALRLREQYANNHVNNNHAAKDEAEREKAMKREWYLELGEESESSLSPSYIGCGVSMGLGSIANLGSGGWQLDRKISPVRTPPPSPPGSISLSPLQMQQLQSMPYHPKPLSMAKLIMSRHAQRKTPPRPRIPRSIMQMPRSSSIPMHREPSPSVSRIAS